ncbi:MAG: glycosyltransferase family 9 protein [Acidobacteriota bacterium]
MSPLTLPDRGDPRFPRVSRPARDFGDPTGRLDEDRSVSSQPGPVSAEALDALTLPTPGPLTVVCPLPIHHVLEFAQLYRIGELLKARASSTELRLLMRSDLDDWSHFHRLPFDRVDSLSRDPRDAEGGEISGACLLVAATPAWRERLHADPTVRVLADLALPYRDVTLDEPTGELLQADFQRALAAASPRWVVRPGTPDRIRLDSVAPRLLIHQARFHIGDTLWLTPLLRGVHRRFPEARTTLVGPPVAAEILAGNPHVAEIVPYSPKISEDQRQEILDRVNRSAFDAALFAFARRHESDWLARGVAEAGVPYRINLEYFDADLDWREIAPWATHEGWCFWAALPSPGMLLHALDPLAKSAASVVPGTSSSNPSSVVPGTFPGVPGTFPGVPGTSSSDRRVELHLPASARRRATEVLAEQGIGGPFAVVAPGGLSSQCWPADCFGELARRLVDELGLTVLVEGGPAEAALLDEVARRAGSWRVRALQDPLPVLAALLESCQLLVSNDSAPIHFAEVAGTPTVYLAQREKLVHSHPANESAWALFDDQANDVTKISVDQVMAASRELLATR